MRKAYLNVDYGDRDLAKKLGARWDPAVKKWYCVPNSSLAKIYGWRRAPAHIDIKTRKEPLSINLETEMTPGSMAAPAPLENLPLFA